MPRSKPALTAALHFLQELIEHQKTQGNSQLLSIKQLSRHAKVSVVTMNRAVKCLSEKGIIEARPGKGIHIQSQNHTLKVVSPARCTRNSIADAIHNSISQGKWTNQLPSRKELAELYGIGPRTVGNALEILHRRGILDIYRRKYIVRQETHSFQQPTVTLVLNAQPQSDITGRRRTIVEHLERLCREYNLTLHRIPFRGATYHAMRTLVQHNKTVFSRSLGIIYLSSGFKSPGIFYLAKALARFETPCFLYSDTDANPDLMHFLHPAESAILCTQPYSEERPGSDMAEYLTKLGHRTIVYLSDVHDTVWSQKRYNGLLKTTLKRADDGQVIPIVRDTPVQIKATNKEVIKQTSTTPFIYRQAQFHKEIIERWEHREVQLRSLFERALEVHEATVWVCGNDHMALLAVDFLRTHGRNVPEDVSVAGFDDITEAHSEGLTTYRFKELELARALFNHLTNMQLLRSTKRKGSIISIGGIVVDRNTTAPVQAFFD